MKNTIQFKINKLKEQVSKVTLRFEPCRADAHLSHSKSLKDLFTYMQYQMQTRKKVIHINTTLPKNIHITIFQKIVMRFLRKKSKHPLPKDVQPFLHISVTYPRDFDGDRAQGTERYMKELMQRFRTDEFMIIECFNERTIVYHYIVLNFDIVSGTIIDPKRYTNQAHAAEEETLRECLMQRERRYLRSRGATGKRKYRFSKKAFRCPENRKFFQTKVYYNLLDRYVYL